jgi:hypothetical protein
MIVNGGEGSWDLRPLSRPPGTALFFAGGSCSVFFMRGIRAMEQSQKFNATGFPFDRIASLTA